MSSTVTCARAASQLPGGMLSRSARGVPWHRRRGSTCTAGRTGRRTRPTRQPQASAPVQRGAHASRRTMSSNPVSSYTFLQSRVTHVSDSGRTAFARVRTASQGRRARRTRAAAPETFRPRTAARRAPVSARPHGACKSQRTHLVSGVLVRVQAEAHCMVRLLDLRVRRLLGQAERVVERARHPAARHAAAPKGRSERGGGGSFGVGPFRPWTR